MSSLVSYTVLLNNPTGVPQVLLALFGNGFVKRHDKSLVCVVVVAVVVLYQQELAGASGRQKLNASQEITLGQVTQYGTYSWYCTP